MNAGPLTRTFHRTMFGTVVSPLGCQATSSPALTTEYEAGSLRYSSFMANTPSGNNSISGLPGVAGMEVFAGPCAGPPRVGHRAI